MIKAISTEELERAVATVITQLKTMEESGKFSARQISQAYDDAAAVLRERFGALPAAFQAAFDAMRSRASTTADGIAAAFERLGLQTREALQRTATEALADFQTIEQAGTATPQALLDAWLDVVDKIDKGAFQTLPAGFQASSTRMTEIARKLGVELPKPLSMPLARSSLPARKPPTAIDTSWLQTRGALERANTATQELTYSTEGLSEKAIMLGHAINSLGEEVNAYGLAAAKATEETQRLLNLQISVKTPFADDMAGLQKQLQQANADLLALGRRIPELGYEGYKQQQKVLHRAHCGAGKTHCRPQTDGHERPRRRHHDRGQPPSPAAPRAAP